MRLWQIALIASLLAPVSAQAYLEPDEVIFADEFSFPPRPSQARERVEQQNQTSAERRAIVYQQLAEERDAKKAAEQQAQQQSVAMPADNTDDIAEHLAGLLRALQQGNGHNAAPAYDDVEWTPVDASDPLADAEWTPVDDGQSVEELLEQGNLDPATERLLKRLQAKKEEEQWAARFAGSTTEQFHSGAPLIDTGAGTTVSLVLLLAAGFWTIARACRKGIIEVRW